MEQIREHINLIISALGGGGIIYLITYFINGKKDRAIEQKTVIGYLKARMTKIEKQNKKQAQEIKEIKEKYLNLEFKFELTDFERRLAIDWIKQQPNSDKFFEEVDNELKTKKDFLERIKKVSSKNDNMLSTLQVVIICTFIFIISLAIMLLFGYIYTINRVSEDTRLEQKKEIILNENN